VGSAEFLERQREAYEAFQNRRRDEYENFQQRRRADYEAYMERMHAQFEIYKRIVGEEEEAEKDRLAQRWDDPELSSAKVWVEYDEDLSERRRVDFESGVVSIERIGDESAGGATEATRDLLREKIRALLTENRATAFSRDTVAQAIEQRSRQEVELLETAAVAPKPILWPYLTGQDQVDPAQLAVAVEMLLDRAVVSESRTRSGETMQRATIPLDSNLLLAQLEKLEAAEMDQAVPEPELRPSMGRSGPLPPTSPPLVVPPSREELKEKAPSPARRLPARAKAFARPVDLYGSRSRLESALIFAIIETESAFNPVARSPAPAYGLMQIVPQSAGQDATQALFGKPRILAPSYLYNAEKNIEIGTTFLDILLTRYLAGIHDPESRLYCAIAAYNSGHGNVFKAFTGRMRPKEAFERINRLSPNEVYDHLVRSMPYLETRRYVPTVVSRLERYRGWIMEP
jgi:membrane-bound lytic murein transglycosylase C